MTNETLNQLQSILEGLTELGDLRAEIKMLECQLDNEKMSRRYEAALSHIEALAEERNFWRNEAEKLAALNGFEFKMN